MHNQENFKINDMACDVGNNHSAAHYMAREGNAMNEIRIKTETDEVSPVIQEVDVIEKFNKKHAVVMVEGKFKVITEPQYGQSTKFSSLSDFHAFYQNDRISEKMSASKYWCNSPDRRQYEGIGFFPDNSGPKEIYNQWQGFAVNPVEGDCSLYLNHISEVIADGDENLNRYILAWMADAVQNPASKPGVAIVMLGDKGTGKGMFTKHFGAIFGNHFLEITQKSQLVDKFNKHLQKTLMVFVDEAFLAGNKSADGPLKALITEDNMMFELKNGDTYRARNHLRLIMATNNDWAVPVGDKERRYLVLTIGKKHQQDHDYFGAIEKQMMQGGREALMHYLLNLDISDINLRDVPKTKALFEQQFNSMPPLQKFWWSKLNDGAGYTDNLSMSLRWKNWETEPVSIPTKELYKEFNEHFKRGRSLNPAQFGKDFRKVCPNVEKIKKVGEQTYLIPPLEECRKDFEKRIGYKSDWGS